MIPSSELKCCLISHSDYLLMLTLKSNLHQLVWTLIFKVTHFTVRSINVKQIYKWLTFYCFLGGEFDLQYWRIKTYTSKTSETALKKYSHFKLISLFSMEDKIKNLILMAAWTDDWLLFSVWPFTQPPKHSRSTTSPHWFGPWSVIHSEYTHSEILKEKKALKSVFLGLRLLSIEMYLNELASSCLGKCVCFLLWCVSGLMFDFSFRKLVDVFSSQGNPPQLFSSI